MVEKLEDVPKEAVPISMGPWSSGRFGRARPPGLLGDDTAPNPSEASLAALGSCIAVGLHANAVHRGWKVKKLELQLEGDLNITGVWGTGDVR